MFFNLQSSPGLCHDDYVIFELTSPDDVILHKYNIEMKVVQKILLVILVLRKCIGASALIWTIIYGEIWIAYGIRTPVEN